MIHIEIKPPAGLNYDGKPFRFGGMEIEKDKFLAGEDKTETIEKYLFLRKSGELKSIVYALGAIPSNIDLECTVGNNKWELSGKISVWLEKDLLLVEQAVEDMENLALLIAEKCPECRLSIIYKFKGELR